MIKTGKIKAHIIVEKLVIVNIKRKTTDMGKTFIVCLVGTVNCLGNGEKIIKAIAFM